MSCCCCSGRCGALGAAAAQGHYRGAGLQLRGSPSRQQPKGRPVIVAGAEKESVQLLDQQDLFVQGGGGGEENCFFGGTPRTEAVLADGCAVGADLGFNNGEVSGELLLRPGCVGAAPSRITVRKK